MEAAKSITVPPGQIGLLLDTAGADGVAFTSTLVILGALGQPFTVAVTL